MLDQPVARRRPLACAAAVLLAVLACTPTAPTASPTASPTSAPSATAVPTGTPVDVQALYREIEDQVVAIRGLQPKQRLEPTVIDGPTLTANLIAQFDKDNKPADLAADEALLTALRLLEPGTSLRTTYLDLQGSQVLGYYSPDDKALFVVSRSGTIGPIEKATFAHEFTHALQDQHFDLSSLHIDDRTNGDRALARLSLVEGDAVATQTDWMVSHLTADDIAQIVAEASDPAVLAAFARAPAILRETSLFPYQAGLAFVGALRGQGGFDAVNDAFGKPPASTAQILHPATYGGGDVQVEDLSRYAEDAGTGWQERREDTLGQLILRVWLRENGVRGADASTAAAGWASDRVALLEDVAGAHLVVLFTTWSTTTDADEFEAAARTALSGEPSKVVIRVSTEQVDFVFGTDAAAMNRIADQIRTAGCC